MEPFAKVSVKESVLLFIIDKWMKKYTGLSAGISSRIGGLSKGAYASLNCGLHVGDRKEDVLENRKRIASALGFPFSAWTCAEQVHGAQVEVITEEQKGSGSKDRSDAIQERDALITDRKDILLCAFFADCVPIYFFDPEREAIGIAHAGWRGTALRVAEATVNAMKEAFSSRPDKILAAIGPSIGPCCYEVGEEVAEKMQNLLSDLVPEGDRGKGIIREENGGKFRLDLKEINRHIMIKAGILPEHIEISRLCTGCNTDIFYSHRKENGKTGRMAAWIGLRTHG